MLFSYSNLSSVSSTGSRILQIAQHAQGSCCMHYANRMANPSSVFCEKFALKESCAKKFSYQNIFVGMADREN